MLQTKWTAQIPDAVYSIDGSEILKVQWRGQHARQISGKKNSMLNWSF
jgi:hypothetical protein